MASSIGSSGRPPGPIPPLTGSPAKRPKQQEAGPRVSNVADTPQERIYQAEKEADRQISLAQQNAERVTRETQEKTDYAAQQGDVAYEKQVASNEERLLNERNKGYESFRALQRQNQAELGRLKREGDKQLSDTDSYYRDTIYKTSRDGDAAITGQLAHDQTVIETQRKTARKEVEDLKAHQREDVARAKTESDALVASFVGESGGRVEQIRASTMENEKIAQKNYEDGFIARKNEHDASLAGLDSAASAQLKRIRQDTAQKLAAYSSRQDDPFYKLLDTGAQLQDKGDHFELTARIPEHEQEHVNVSIKGNSIVLSGFRRNLEELDLGSGRARSTSAYQSYSESFPVIGPVDPRQLTKEFDGDKLIARVPKLTSLQAEVQHQPPPGKARAERPVFPDHLPGITSSPRSNKPLV